MKGEISVSPGRAERADEPGRRSSNLARLAAAAALLSALLSGPGCTLFFPGYPAQLPRLAPSVGGDTDQPVVAGRYCDEGWKLDGEARKPGDIRLSQMLDRRWTRDAEGTIDNVTVSGPADDEIQLQVRQGDAVVGAGQVLKRSRFWAPNVRTYSCREGFMQMFLASVDMDLYLVFSFHERIHLLMRRAVDGSLIVLIRNTGERFVVAVPWLKNENNWYVFPPYPAASPPVPGPQAK